MRKNYFYEQEFYTEGSKVPLSDAQYFSCPVVEQSKAVAA